VFVCSLTFSEWGLKVFRRVEGLRAAGVPYIPERLSWRFATTSGSMTSPRTNKARKLAVAFTIELTSDQEERLRLEALCRGIDKHLLAQQLLGQALNKIEADALLQARKSVLGLRGGSTSAESHYGTPMPGRFWLGKE
jgi:hypothetical protein